MDIAAPLADDPYLACHNGIEMCHAHPPQN
jgi:hypothetical protein